MLNAEIYYKTTDGLSRYIRAKNRSIEDTFEGNAKSFGSDFFLKYNLNGHTFWASYTLSKTIEHFEYLNYINIDEYLFAPQDQRHEIKLAGIIDLNPFYISANYVYGSGFLLNPFLQNKSDERIPYNRLDASFTYKFYKKKNIGEVGISILNVLNTENKKISNLEKIPLSQLNSATISFEAMPFTPTIFLILRF